jgi:chemotaxis response regulator CheB
VDDIRAVKEAEAGADGRWLLQQFAPDVVAMLEAAPDAADLSRLVELLGKGSEMWHGIATAR